MKEELARLRNVSCHDGSWWAESQISHDLAEKIMGILESSKVSDLTLVNECQVSYMGNDNISYMILMFEEKSGPKKFFDVLESKLEE